MNTPALASILLAATLCGSGCSDETSPSAPGPDAAVVPDGGDPSAALFDKTKIVSIRIQMAPADWDFIRQQKRTDGENLAGPDCLSKPWVSPYIYKPATATIDGQRFEGVGVRKKGFIGSVNAIKPSLKLKLDAFAAGQDLAGYERVTLNNNISDPSFLRQCLTYQLFRTAGLPAPRCNFATVEVNGQNLGLYSNIESIKKRFLGRHFAERDGNLYEGTLSDFRDGWLATWEAKTSSTDASFGPILAVKAALATPDDRLVAALAEKIDLDAFYRHWAMEVLVNHADGYANLGNNFYVYQAPKNGKLYFIAWGVDNTLSTFSKQPAGAPSNVFAQMALSRRLYLLPNARSKYVAALRDVLTTVWDETKLSAEIDRIEKLIGAAAASDPYVAASSKPGAGFTKGLASVRDFVSKRRAELQPVIDSPPAWSLRLRPRLCDETKPPAAPSTGSGSFTTGFDTLGSKDPFASGGGTLTLKENGKSIAVARVGAEAGADPKAPGRILVRVVADVAAGQQRVATFSIAASAFIPGATIAVDPKNTKTGDLVGALTGQDSSSGKTWTVGTLSAGSVTLGKAGANVSEAVDGSFDATWVAGGK